MSIKRESQTIDIPAYNYEYGSTHTQVQLKNEVQVTPA